MSAIGHLAVKENKIYMDSMAGLEELRGYADPDSELQRKIAEKEIKLKDLKESVDSTLRRALLAYSIPIRQAFVSEGTVTIQTCVGFDLYGLAKMLRYFDDWEKEGKYKVRIDYVGDGMTHGKYFKVMVTPTANLKDNKIPSDISELAKLEKDSIVAKSHGELQFPEISIATQDGRDMIDALAVQLFALTDIDRLNSSVADELESMFKVFR